jgi:hypothetical protein
VLDYRTMADVHADVQDIVGERTTREGWDAPVETDEQRRAAIEVAFDYRGDVTLVTRDGRELVGYIYDRRLDGDRPVLRILLAAGGRATVGYDEVARLRFTGRDTAAGTSWETWVRKYIEKKQRGEAASIEPEPG